MRGQQEDRGAQAARGVWLWGRVAAICTPHCRPRLLVAGTRRLHPVFHAPAVATRALQLRLQSARALHALVLRAARAGAPHGAGPCLRRQWRRYGCRSFAARLHLCGCAPGLCSHAAAFDCRLLHCMFARPVQAKRATANSNVAHEQQHSDTAWTPSATCCAACACSATTRPAKSAWTIINQQIPKVDRSKQMLTFAASAARESPGL